MQPLYSSSQELFPLPLLPFLPLPCTQASFQGVRDLKGNTRCGRAVIEKYRNNDSKKGDGKYVYIHY